MALFVYNLYSLLFCFVWLPHFGKIFQRFRVSLLRQLIVCYHGTSRVTKEVTIIKSNQLFQMASNSLDVYHEMF